MRGIGPKLLLGYAVIGCRRGHMIKEMRKIKLAASGYDLSSYFIT